MYTSSSDSALIPYIKHDLFGMRRQNAIPRAALITYIVFQTKHVFSMHAKLKRTMVCNLTLIEMLVKHKKLNCCKYS